MGKTSRHRRTAVICALVAFSLAFVPVAHASMAIMNGLFAPDSGTAHRCDQDPAAMADVSINPVHAHPGGAISTDCEHGAACQILCSISLLHYGAIETGSHDNLNSWFRPDSPGLNDAFTSRLERPPRT